MRVLRNMLVVNYTYTDYIKDTKKDDRDTPRTPDTPKEAREVSVRKGRSLRKNS